jgi:hypothetical protein
MPRDELPATRPLDWGKERHKNGQLRVPAENALRDDRAWAGILRPAQESWLFAYRDNFLRPLPY